MKKLIATLALIIAAPLALQSNAALAETEKTKQVVYHVNKSDMNTIKAALRNVTNHINSPSGPETQIEIAVHGGGIAMLTEARNDPQLQAAIDNVKAHDVEIKVCANTLRGKNLDVKDDLYDTKESDVVPSGVAHVADRQAEGWAYIHP
ncbi:DsrE family protein [Guyparkeria sp. TX1]|uniref:DsrE family protein n=1 Tax=Guyparkeria sp. TX1 TaxID=3115001 RepID=UPI0039775C48